LSPESLLLGAPIGTVPELVRAANPATYARADAPPMLLIHGVDDPLVPHGQSELLHRALEDVGADTTFVSVPNIGHDHPYVADAELSSGRLVMSTRRSGHDLDLLRDQGPTWEAVATFLTGAFERGVPARPEP
jgi:acetyl esterase/lipase